MVENKDIKNGLEVLKTLLQKKWKKNFEQIAKKFRQKSPYRYREIVKTKIFHPLMTSITMHI